MSRHTKLSKMVSEGREDYDDDYSDNEEKDLTQGLHFFM
jgi:hypothetical protein